MVPAWRAMAFRPACISLRNVITAVVAYPTPKKTVGLSSGSSILLSAISSEPVRRMAARKRWTQTGRSKQIFIRHEDATRFIANFRVCMEELDVPSLGKLRFLV